MAEVTAGDEAPDFALSSQSGEEVRLSDFIGKKNVVLYFYPKDFTSGCTAEARAFRDSYQVFFDSDTEVIGVSSDTVETHHRFAEHCGLPFNILSDTSKRVMDQYGIPGGIFSGRMTFVIDKEGIVKYVFSSRLQPTRHVREALEALKRDQAVKKPIT
jgi:thioredoxin-dependent peroxiredoxin